MPGRLLLQRMGIKLEDGEFDVAMGAYDGVEVSELIGLYLKREKLKITTSINIKRTDFLDFELDLETGKVRPWRKPNNDPKYINVNSSHPATNIKCLPIMIENRLTGLSSSEEEFNDVKLSYENALKDAGYEETALKYNKQPERTAKRSRKRKVTWFNPPFSSQVTSNITKLFNNLIEKYFKKGTLLGKLFNKNSLKLSYSTTANLGQIISGHNKHDKRILTKKLRCTYIQWRWLSFCYHFKGNQRVASRRLRYANKHIMRRCDIDTEDYEC